jgi:hypothetical protein
MPEGRIVGNNVGATVRTGLPGAAVFAGAGVSVDVAVGVRVGVSEAVGDAVSVGSGVAEGGSGVGVADETAVSVGSSVASGAASLLRQAATPSNRSKLMRKNRRFTSISYRQAQDLPLNLTD